MAQLRHDRVERLRDGWGEVDQGAALAALNEAAVRRPDGTTTAQLVHRGLELVWLLARSGRALRSLVERLSSEEIEIAKTTAIEAAYKRLAALREGRRRRASLLNNLVNVMSYAVRENSSGHAGDVVSISDWHESIAEKPTNRQSGKSTFEGKESILDDSDDREDDEAFEQRTGTRTRSRYVTELEERWSNALRAGLVPPLGTLDPIGRRFEIWRYHFRLFGFEDLPQVDHLEMEARLALAPDAGMAMSNRGELKRLAEADGGTPEEIRRRYNALRQQRSRAKRVRASAKSLDKESTTAIEEVVERLEFPVRARIALGGRPDNSSDRYRRASRSLQESFRAANGRWPGTGHSPTEQFPLKGKEKDE